MWRALLVVGLSLASGEAMAQYTSFLLINGMAYPISQLSVSESDFNFWTPNVLHPPPIKAGERRQVTFNAPTTYCQADLRVEFADGGRRPADVRVLSGSELTLVVTIPATVKTLEFAF